MNHTPDLTHAHNHHANRTILVVENEPLIREAIQDILHNLGMNVISTATGREGLHAYHRFQNDVDLIILDMNLPELDGADTLKAIRDIDPGARVIISSGLDENEIARRLPDLNSVFLLHKPYNLEMFVSKVNTALTC